MQLVFKMFLLGAGGGGGGGESYSGISLEKSALNAIYCIGKNLEFRGEPFHYGILIANTICHMSIYLTFVECHKARPHERSSYWSIIYSWCILSYILHVKYPYLSFVLFSKRATSVILNCF